MNVVERLGLTDYFLLVTGLNRTHVRALQNELHVRAKALGARATAVVVIEPFHLLTANVEQIESTRADYEAHAARHAADILAAAGAKAEAAGVAFAGRTAKHDHPYEAIIATAADEGCDVIAMASHGST